MAILFSSHIQPPPIFDTNQPAQQSLASNNLWSQLSPPSTINLVLRADVATALNNISDKILSDAGNLTNKYNKLVETQRAQRIHNLAEKIAFNDQLSDETWAAGIREIQRNVGFNPDGTVAVGALPLPITGIYDETTQLAVKKLTAGESTFFSNTKPVVESDTDFQTNSSVKTFRDTVDLKSARGIEKAINDLGFDHPLVVQALADATDTEPQFIRKVFLVADQVETSPLHVLNVVAFETAETFGTGKYPSVQTVGLIQMTPAGVAQQDSVESGKETPEQYLNRISKMSRTTQMNEVLEYWLDRKDDAGGDYQKLVKLYLAVLAPAALSDVDENGLKTVLYSREATPLYYNANKGLDRNQDGDISAGETIGRLFETRDRLLEKTGLALKEKLK